MTAHTSRRPGIRLASTLTPMPRDTIRARARDRMGASAVFASVVGLGLAIVNYVL